MMDRQHLSLMLRQLLLVSALLTAGCLPVSWQAAPPTAVAEPAVLAQFANSAPQPRRVVATPTPGPDSLASLPPGLPLPAVEPLTVLGNMRVIGSPAVAPLTRLLYARFVSDGYQDTMKIEEIGTDAGFQQFCATAPTDSAGPDLVMADRTILQSELEHCLEQERWPVALHVAFDAVVVVSHADHFLHNANKSELTGIFSLVYWSDIHREWPHSAIIRIVPPHTSMTTAIFSNKILGSTAQLFQDRLAATNGESGEELAFTIADTPMAVGILNYANYAKNQDILRLITLNGIQPDSGTVSSGAYALTYPLLLYTDLTTLKTKPQVGAFLMYYLTHMNEMMREATLFPVNEAIYERSKVVLLTALGQQSYLEQFSPTSTPAPPPTMTPTATLTPTLTGAPPTVTLTPQPIITAEIGRTPPAQTMLTMTATVTK